MFRHSVVLLFIVSVSRMSCHLIITKSMIRTPDDGKTEDDGFERVALKSKEDSASLEEDASDGREFQEESEETEESQEVESEEEPRNATKRTKLYPVAEEESFSEERQTSVVAELVTVLRRVYDCLWSDEALFGCISGRVVPLVRMMMGQKPYLEYTNNYIIPRTQDDDLEEDSNIGRRKKASKLMFGLMLAVVGLKFVVLPALGTLALVSGKAVLFSLLSVAMAAFASRVSPSAANRISSQPDQPSSFYM